MAVTSLARSFFMARVPLWHEWGWNPTRMVDMGRVLGMSYRRQDMFSDITNILGRYKYERQVSGFASDQPIAKRFMTEATLKHPRSYMGFAHVQYTDNSTGETFDRDVSFYDDSNRGSDGWLSRYEENHQETLEKSDISITGWELYGVLHNKGAPY